MEPESGDGGWVTHQYEEGTLGGGGLEDKVSEMTLESNTDNCMEDELNARQDDGEDEGDDDDEDACDMEEFAESGMLEKVEPATATRIRKTADTEKTSSLDADTDSVDHTRTYDLHITYDKYYQTPRLWVVGYDEVNRK